MKTTASDAVNKNQAIPLAQAVIDIGRPWSRERRVAVWPQVANTPGIDLHKQRKRHGEAARRAVTVAKLPRALGSMELRA